MTGSAARLSAVFGLVLLVLAALILPGCTPDVAIRQPTTLNLKEVTKAAIAYTSHHDNRLPPGHSWPQALATEENLPETALLDPANPSAGRMFAMNARLSNLPRADVRRASETVLLFECAPARPRAADRNSCRPSREVPRGTPSRTPTATWNS